MKFVEVEWTDAISSSTRVFTEDLIKEDLPITKSCGYLIHEDKEKIIIASMMYENVIEQSQMIPKGMIKKIKVIRK